MAAQVNQQGLVDPAGFKRMNTEIARSSQVYRNALASTGMFRVEQLRVNSAADDYTKKLQAQKLGLRDLVKQQKIAAAAYKEQLAMQQMVVRTSASGAMNGKQVVDVSFPDRVNAQLDTFKNRLGFANEQMRSLATQTVNWGKNTQWAGRQLMTGFTIPVGIAAAAAGKFAYDMDASITRIQKVYDAGANGIKASNESIKADAIQSSKQLASLYGQSADDTLAIMAELAAAGKTGIDLQQQTADVSRAALLGDLDREDALKTNITLQSAYNMSTKDLADTWNFFNSVENSTVLSMKDITEALPRVSGIMNTLGVSVQDTTTLLTGFKAAGIDAVEGATALKSVSFKIFNPSKKATSAFEQLTGINYAEVIKQGKGQLIPTLTAISDAVKGLNNVQKTQIIGDLAGIHQGSKFAGLITQLEDIGDATTQIGRANKVAQQSTTDWANTANGELQTLQDSVSNKLKRAFASLKVELATMGEPFLKVGADVLNFILKIVKAFNGLPDGAKQAAVITAILLAAAGPAIMLVGLTANLLGNFLKMGVSLIGLATRFELLTKEQRAAQLAAKLAESGFISERQALANLTAEMEKYRLAQEAANKPIMSRVPPSTVAAPASTAGSMSGTLAGGWLPANVAAAQANNAAQSQAAAAASEKQKAALKGVAESGGLFAAAMVTSAVSSNKTVDNIANIAMLASIAGPALVGAAKALTAVKWAEIGSAISGKMSTGMSSIAGKAGQFTSAWKSAPGMVSKTSMIVKGLGSGIAGLLGPMGLFLIAIGAVIAAWKLIDHSVHKTADAIKETNNNSKLGGILGYEAKTAQAMAQTSKSATAVHDKVAQIRNEFGGVIDNIKKANSEQEKFNIAMQHIGLQVISQGGTIDQAQEAVRLALQAAGETADQAQAISIKFKGEFDSSGIVDQAELAAEDFQKSAIDAMQKFNFGETLQNNFKNDKYISKASEQFGKDAGDKLAQGIRTSLDAGLGQGKMLENIDKSLKPIGDRLATLRKLQDQVRGEGRGGSAEDQQLSDQITQYEKLRAAVTGQIVTNLSGADATKKFTESQLANMTATDILKNGYIALTDADMLQYLQAKKSSGALLDTGEAEKLAALQAAELAKKSGQVTAGLQANGKAAVDTRNDFEKLTDALGGMAAAAPKFADAAQSGTKAAMSEYADQAQKNFSDRMDSAMDAYKKSQDARMDALQRMQDKASKALDARQDQDNKRLESRQKAAQRRLDDIQQAQNDALDKSQDNRRKSIEASYDSRIDKIKQTMTTEQAAEDLRQKIFDAEMTRISRLAEAANRNIDFNSALNSGNMDEAAKIMNDSQAAQEQWGLSDANDSAKNAFDKRQDALGASIDAISKAKDARLDALKVVEDAEKKALEASQQRQTDALAAQQDREKTALAARLQAEKDNLAARQKAEQAVLQTRIDQNVKAEQRIWDSRKAQLDRAIVDFQNFAPRNAAELQKHIADISGKYDQFRVTTRGKFNGTAADVKSVLSRNITAAMQELAANTQWETVGADIATKMTKGAFNMDMNQFVKWITTGETPSGWTASKSAIDAAAKLNAANMNKKNAKDRRLPAYHVGGEIGVDPGGRAGITGSGLHRSEKLIVAQHGEYMVNKDAYSKNKSIVQAINSGADLGGNPHIHKGDAADGPLGFVGMMGAGIAAAASMAIGAALATAASRRINADAAAIGAGGGMYTAGKAGKYGGQNFSAEQLSNASLIATVGSQMGMSARDIEIGIMTAITESGLKNLKGGDRDSIGLFQQRPSQGWGTPAQIGDPNYAARKFFESLQGVKGRAGMDPWLAAQAVQRSFDSSGSNYRQYWDEAMAIFKGFGVGGAADLGGIYKNAYGKTSWDGEPIDNLTAAQLSVAGRLLGKRYHVIQGSFQPATSYSGTTHTGGGVIDVSPYDNNAVVALQQAGFAAWHRGPGAPGKAANYGNHIHAVSLFDKQVAKSAAAQAAQYRNMSGDGLGQKYYGPHAAVINNLLGQLPQFKDGGFSLSHGLAELHGTKSLPEATLSAPLTQKFKEGVNNFANGSGTTYNVNVDARYAQRDAAGDIVKMTIAEIKKIEARKPQPRKGTDS
jgi:TP901 family phage tail tape measure protein